MAGTLYEWCRNAFDDPDNLDFPASAQERRAVRGGSWLHNLTFARCAARTGSFPFGRVNFVGLRVCCASPIA